MRFFKYLWNKFKKLCIDNYKGIPTMSDDEWFLYNGYVNENYKVEE